jgi:hypothetical protein
MLIYVPVSELDDRETFTLCWEGVPEVSSSLIEFDACVPVVEF